MFTTTLSDVISRGIVLQTLYDLGIMSSFYLRSDIVEGACDILQEDFDRVILQLIDATMVEVEFQHSYILNNDISTIKITQFGIDIINRIIESPIPIEFEC